MGRTECRDIRAWLGEGVTEGVGREIPPFPRVMILSFREGILFGIKSSNFFFN